jgi:ABC-type nitrate/sulfonate/bicarbonate transport systems, periplasmic components
VLQESSRYLFYAPFYSALALGAYQEEGVDVRFICADGSPYGRGAILSGAVDVAWGGPSRVISAYDNDPASDLVCFCEVVTRDPFFLVGREPRPGLSLRDLKGLRVATVSEVPTPWLCLQEDLRRAEIDPATLDRSSNHTMVENVARLKRGDVDVIQLFEPFVSELVNCGRGHVWYAGADRGPTSFTTFYTRRSTLERRRDEFRSMVRAIYRTQKWIHASEADRIARLITGYFSDLSEAQVVSAVCRYKQFGIWGRDPRLPKAGFERLRASFISGRFITRGVTYEQAVDNSLVEEVIAEAPLALVR